MTRAITVILAILAAGPIAGRSQQAESTVSGVVLDAATRAPVGGAEVSLSNHGLLSTLTANDGSFRFSHVNIGAYYVVAAKNQNRGAYGRRWLGGEASVLQVSADQRHQLTILLWPAASISGTVFDERNLPLAGVTVRVARLDETGTASSWSAANMRGMMLGPSRVPRVFDLEAAQTNDRGEYDIHRLTPGHYVVCVPISHATLATLASPFTVTQYSGVIRDQGSNTWLRVESEPTPPPGGAAQPLTYVTTCSSSARSAAAATVVALGLGEERTNVDVRMRLERRFRVSGRIVQPQDSLKDVDLVLTPIGATSPVDEGPTAGSDGERFVFMSVPPGDYWLEARRSVGHSDVIMTDKRGLSSRQRVSVTDADLNDVVVSLQPGFSVTGRFLCEGAATADVCAKSFPKLDGKQWFGWPSWQGEGRFTIDGLPPDLYAVNISPTDLPQGWHFRSAVVAGRDVIKTGLEIRDRDVTDFVVTLTRDRTAVRGRVQDRESDTEDAVVVVFPQDSTAWKPLATKPPFLTAVSPAADGRYEIFDLPEGDYWIAAVRGRQLNDFPGRERLAALATFADRIHVGFGSPVVADLSVRPR